MSEVVNIFRVPELKRRILFTCLVLIVYGFFDLFAGGALRRASIFALGVMPYIDASIILQLLAVVVPAIERMQKEGAEGRKKITQYTRYGTVLIALIQGMGISIGLEGVTANGQPVVPNPGWGFRIMATLTLTAGSVLLMWLGGQISERGIGNGISLLIFAGIIVNLPEAMYRSYELLSTGEMKAYVLLFLVVIMVLVVAGVVVMTLGQRPIPVQYAKRVVGRKVYGGQATHIPLRVNMVGVALDTAQQIEAHLLMRHYEGFLKKGKMRGRAF